MLLRKARAAKAEVGVEEKLKRILQMRAAVSATAKMRLPVSAKIVEQNRGARTIVFHERVSSAKALFDVLQQRNHSVCLYTTRKSRRKCGATICASFGEAFLMS